MISTCLVYIPLHPKHYDYIYELMDEPVQLPFDYCFCFTNQSDLEMFAYKDRLDGNKYKRFLLTDICSEKRFRLFEYKRSWVNVKKLCGLKHIYLTMPSYEHILVFDAEIKIINKDVDHVGLIREVCERAEILGSGKYKSPCWHALNIHRCSIRMLHRGWRRGLNALTNNGCYCAWFTNIPIYERKYLGEFFDVLGPGFENNLSYFSFDHVIYYLFLAVRGYWKLRNIEDFGHSVGLECSNDINPYIDASKQFPLLWVRDSIYRENKEYIEKEDKRAFISFHRDRT